MLPETQLSTCPACGCAANELAEARRLIENLQVALTSSRHISAAVGILMERLKISMDDAFGVLVYASQNEHRKLRDIAEDLVFTGALPDRWPRTDPAAPNPRSWPQLQAFAKPSDPSARG
jgi:hypothetical protein